MKNVILLVEDNPSDEKLTLLAFKNCGVANDVVVVRDGAAALAYLSTTETLPAVVLLDLKLPKIDGLEVLRRLRAHKRTRLLPVVVLTASGEDEDILRSYSFGANAYVRKSIEFNAFSKAASTVGEFWLHVNERPPTQRGPT